MAPYFDLFIDYNLDQYQDQNKFFPACPLITFLKCMLIIVSGLITKLALRIATQVHEMRRAFVSGIVRPNGFSAFYTLKAKRLSFSSRCGVSDCQRLFNRNEMPIKFTLVCHSHCLALHLTN
jgi:hypothetical protein